MKLWLIGVVIAASALIHIESKQHSDSVKDDSEAEISLGIHEDLPVPMNPGLTLSPPIEIQLEGEYYWERIYYIDNRNQNNPYKETRKVTKRVTTSYSDLKKSVQEESIKSSMSSEIGGVFDIITVGVKGSLDSELSRSYQSTVEKKSETVVTEELTREFSVGANSIGEMFRLIYKGPGVIYETGTVSTDGNLPLDKVFITCTVRQTPFIKDIQVIYTSQSVDRPENIVTETRGGSPDINKGFGGKYVWLVPVWTTKEEEAVSKMQVVIQGNHNDGYLDLAKGAGGKYRYLKMLKDSHSHTRIKRIGLLRSPKAKYIYGDRQEYGWDECTGDINEDRKGDWLHLCWNTVSIV